MGQAELDHFRDNLRRLCEGRQREIAKAAGIHRVQLSRIINGHSSTNIETACEIAKALGVSLTTLIQRPRSRAKAS